MAFREIRPREQSREGGDGGVGGEDLVVGFLQVEGGGGWRWWWLVGRMFWVGEKIVVRGGGGGVIRLVEEIVEVGLEVEVCGWVSHASSGGVQGADCGLVLDEYVC